jgi:hypothetical protein
MWDYLELGFAHVLPLGLDHLLFVLGITLGSLGRLRRLLAELSVFTVAHTVSLFLGALGWVVLPAALTEFLIALSIVAIGAENFLEHRPTWSRLATIFGFGLLHGQGFAGALSRIRIPRADFVSSLLGFNIGVELAQICSAGVAVLTLSFVRSETARPHVLRGLSALVALAGLFWCVERVGAL